MNYIEILQLSLFSEHKLRIFPCTNCYKPHRISFSLSDRLFSLLFFLFFFFLLFSSDQNFFCVLSVWFEIDLTLALFTRCLYFSPSYQFPEIFWMKRLRNSEDKVMQTTHSSSDVKRARFRKHGLTGRWQGNVRFCSSWSSSWFFEIDSVGG